MEKTIGTKMVVVKIESKYMGRVAMSDLQILPNFFGTITGLTASICIPPILATLFVPNFYLKKNSDIITSTNPNKTYGVREPHHEVSQARAGTSREVLKKKPSKQSI